MYSATRDLAKIDVATSPILMRYCKGGRQKPSMKREFYFELHQCGGTLTLTGGDGHCLALDLSVGQLVAVCGK